MDAEFNVTIWAQGVADRLQSALARGYVAEMRSVPVDDLVSAIQIIRDSAKALADTERFEGLQRLARGRDWQVVSGGTILGKGPIRRAVDQAIAVLPNAMMSGPEDNANPSPGSSDKL